MATVTLHHDFETFSEVDLTATGSDVYHRHPSTEVLMAAYSICEGPKHDAPFEQWLPVEGQRIPTDLKDAMRDPSVIKVAWNSPFEKGVWRHVLGFDVRPAEWRDPMILAMAMSFPGKLEKAGEILGMAEEDKKQAARGKALMRVFSFPRKPTKTDLSTRNHWYQPKLSEKWEEYKQYNINDVKAERAIWRKLLPYNMPTEEWRNWLLDQEINDTGIPVNREMINRAVDLVDYLLEKKLAEMNELTGLENANSGSQLLPWLQKRGYPFNDLKAGHVKRAYEAATVPQGMLRVMKPGSNHGPEYGKVLELRAETSRTSIKKYAALQRAIGPDDNIRWCFQFAGAQRTWRWAGRIFQPQNLPRPTSEFKSMSAQRMAARHLETLDPDVIEQIYPKPIDLLASSIRNAVQAPDGQVFIDADLNAIENRVLGWMAEDEKILQVFALNRDPYIDFSTYMFGGSYDERWSEYKDAGDSTKRTTSKPAVLGCGYMLSAGKQFENKQTGEIEATGLLGYAWNMGVKLTPEQSELSVAVWRDTFEGAVNYWSTIEKAAKACVRTGREMEAGPVQFYMDGPFLRMRLPSGRSLSYFRPKVSMQLMPWGKEKMSLTYMGLNDKKQWSVIQTHPGKLTENADQAISRDLLVHGMRLARKEGIRTRVHIHDQVVAAVPEDEAEEKLQILRECMQVRPKWAPGLPLGSAGHISKIMVKD